jgi:hypothetical protein
MKHSWLMHFRWPQMTQEAWLFVAIVLTLLSMYVFLNVPDDKDDE